MLKSMTGYAVSEKIENDWAVSVEIRTYNSRYLDIALRLSHGFLPLEDRIKSQAARSLSRGRVELNVQVREVAAGEYDVEIDDVKLRAYQEALAHVSETFGIRGELPVEFLLGTGGIIRLVERQKDVERCWPLIEATLDSALIDLDAMRRKEGAVLAEDFAQRLTLIQDCLNRIREASAELPPIYRQRLGERIVSLTQGMVEVDPGRIAQEAAFLADRSDISEEIVRAESHLEQFRNIMTSEASCGRKLNFLLQEFNREFTTMGSKAGNADISHIIVTVKSELEKIREQVQNVE